MIEIEQNGEYWSITFEGGLMESGTLSQCAKWLMLNAEDIENGKL